MLQKNAGFLRPTQSTIAASFLVAIILIADQILAVQSWPEETLFSQIYYVVFTPAHEIRQFLLNLMSAGERSALTGPFTFLLDTLTFYLLGCIMVYLLRRRQASTNKR